MQIVIDIPESVYENTKRYGLNKVWKDTEIIEEAIISGIVLPEHHGRLIDRYEFRKAIDECLPFTKCYQDRNPTLNRAKSDLLKCLADAPTIIEATKEV